MTDSTPPVPSSERPALARTWPMNGLFDLGRSHLVALAGLEGLHHHRSARQATDDGALDTLHRLGRLEFSFDLSAGRQRLLRLEDDVLALVDSRPSDTALHVAARTAAQAMRGLARLSEALKPSAKPDDAVAVRSGVRGPGDGAIRPPRDPGLALVGDRG